MGSPASEVGRSNLEDQVNVTLSRGFWLGQTEVTQGLWRNVMGTTPWSGQKLGMEGAEYPATYVSWEDATEFCRKLTTREQEAGRLPSAWSYRLPTEAEWEYSCRAGLTTPYSVNGAGLLSEYAWYDKNASEVGQKYAHPVGQKKANGWGLADMHGNVWEWCEDQMLGNTPSTAKLIGGRDPLGNGGPWWSGRAFRGGSFAHAAIYCRSANRNNNIQSTRGADLGFRCALSLSAN